MESIEEDTYLGDIISGLEILVLHQYVKLQNHQKKIILLQFLFTITGPAANLSFKSRLS